MCIEKQYKLYNAAMQTKHLTEVSNLFVSLAHWASHKGLWMFKHSDEKALFYYKATPLSFMYAQESSIGKVFE